MTKVAAQQIVNAASLSPLDIAKTAGALQACADAGMNWKEASEFLNLPAQALQAVHTLHFGG